MKQGLLVAFTVAAGFAQLQIGLPTPATADGTQAGLGWMFAAFMNRLYERTTKRRTTSQLDAALRAEVAAHAEAHQLGDVLGAAVNCYATWSVRLRGPGLLSRLTGSGDPDTEHRTVVVVAPRYVVVAVEGKRRGVHVRAARLDGVSLSESSELHRLDRDAAASAGRFGRLPPAARTVRRAAP
ncbi:hypothetical protein [Streptomyces avermitilis]|uniref:hypothetical protein n=1 Tax=Streptomyces avermitilis TaxID=33903 RepID=UPI0033BD5A1C